MKGSELSGSTIKLLADPTPPKDSSLKNIRWFALIFGAFSIIGPIISFAFVTTLETQIEDIFNVDDGQYNLLFSLGGIPSLFMPLVGGYLADYLGARTTFMAALIAITIGELVSAYACTIANFDILLLGNIIYLSSWDTFSVSRTKLICTIFYSENVSLAVGIAVVTQKLCILLNNIITPWVYNQTNSLALTWLLPIGLCIVSLISGSVFVLTDKKFKLSEQNPSLTTDEQTNVTEKVKVSDIKKINKLLWSFIVFSAFCYCVYLCLLDNLNTLLERIYNFSTQQAGDVASTYTIASVITTIIISYLINRTKKRTYAVFFAAISINMVFLTLNLLPSCDQCYISLVPLCFVGFFAGSYLVLSSNIIPCLIDKKLIGLALGVNSFVINILSVASPYVFGIIMDNTKVDGQYDYQWAFIAMQATSAVGLLMAVVLYFLDIKMGKPLDAIKPEDNQHLWNKTESS